MMQQWRSVKQTLTTTLKAGCLVAGLLMAAGSSRAGAQDSLTTSNPAATRTTLTAATSATETGTQTMLTAHVTDAVGNAVSGGTVSFRLQASTGAAPTTAADLGAAVVDTDGDAEITLTNLPGSSTAQAASGQSSSGTLPVVAVYNAVASTATTQATYASSVSSVSQLHANATAAPDFTLTANPASVTTTAGSYATTVITVSPQNGFSEQVTLSCSNVPADVTCNFTPNIASTSGGAFTSSLQLQTQGSAGTQSRLRRQRHDGSTTALAIVLPGILALLGFAGVTRRTFRGSRIAGLALLLVAGTIGMSGCNVRYSYLKHPPIEPSGVASGTMTLNVNASGNNGSAVTQHNIAVTLVVQ